MKTPPLCQTSVAFQRPGIVKLTVSPISFDLKTDHKNSMPASNPQTSHDNQNTWSVLRRLARYLGRYKARVALSLAALLVAAAATLAMPVAFRFLIDLGFASPQDAINSQSGISGSNVNLVFIGLFALATVLAISTAVRFYCVSWLGERITADLRSDVYSQVLLQDPQFFESLKTGEVLSRLSSDTTLIQSLIGTSISLGMRNTLLFVGSLVMMLYTDLRLAGIIVAMLLIVVIPILVFGRRVRKLSRTSQDKLADTGAMAGETLNAMEIVQAYGREPLESKKYADATDLAFTAAIKRNQSRSLLTAMAIVLVFGAIVLVLWLGANAVIDGRLSTGLLTQFIMYAVIVGGSAATMAEVFGDVQRAVGATTRLVELLDAEPSIKSCPPVDSNTPITDKGSARSAEAGAGLSFENVSFSYPSRPQELSLNNLSFTASPGETIAIVGPSGAGKTTILQLLLRFYDPQSGVINFNGTPLSQIHVPDLRNSIGLVSQDSVVFSENAMENIRYGRLDASDDEVHAAAADAQADEFIRRLPEGYNTYLGERGTRLSGGQRQRLSIARALVKNPPLLLLDEATSALDARSEHKVQAALERAMKGRTTLVIAHRLATIKNADKIIVLDQGRLVETGTHTELSQSNGVYASLAAMQFNNQ